MAEQVKQEGLFIHERCFDPGLGDSLHLKENPNHDPFVAKFLRENLKEGDLFIDIGAHVGYFTVLGSQLVGKNGLVVAFEPSPKAFEVLKFNINGLTNVFAQPVAISDATDEHLSLYEQKEGWGQNSLYEKLVDRGEWEPVEVPVASLDDYLNVDQPVVCDIVIKCDTQGNEVKVLSGATALLKTGKVKAMVLELWPMGLKEAGAEVKELFDMVSNQYDIFTDTPSGVVPCNYERAMVEYGDGKRAFGDIFCIRKPNATE